MRAISLVLFSVLLVSCGKDKKQIPAGTTNNQQVQTTPGNSSRPGSNPSTTNSGDKNFAIGGCSESNDKVIEGKLNAFIANMYDKEIAAVHCVSKVEKDGSCEERHSLFTFERAKKDISRKVTVRKRILKKDLSATDKLVELEDLLVGRKNYVGGESFRMGRNSQDELLSIIFYVPEKNLAKPIKIKPNSLKIEDGATLENNCSVL